MRPFTFRDPAFLGMVRQQQIAKADLMTSIISLWRFEESGAATDRADTVGATTLSAVACSQITGKVGNGVSVNFGSGGSLQNGSPSGLSFTSGADFSVAGWFKLNSLPADEFTFWPVIQLPSLVLTVNRYQGFSLVAHSASGWVQGGGGFDPMTPWITGVWYHIGAAFNASTATLQQFLNGADNGAVSGLSGITSDTTGLKFGKSSVGGISTTLDGGFDEWAAWNRALPKTAMLRLASGPAWPWT